MIGTLFLSFIALHDQHDGIAAPHARRALSPAGKVWWSPTCSDSWSTTCPPQTPTEPRVVLRDICTGKNRADHIIHVRLNPEVHGVDGIEKITYHNQSPDALRYLWMQLIKIDTHQIRERTSLTAGSIWISSQSGGSRWPRDLPIPEARRSITSKTAKAKNWHSPSGSMMRIDLPQPLTSGEVFQFEVKWSHRITLRCCPVSQWVRNSR